MRAQILFVPFVLASLVSCQPADDQASESAISPELGSTSSSITEPSETESDIVETEEEQERRLRATFPAQQRELADPELIARGDALFGINCRSCHGQDLRGGDLGGPNLLRSQVVLSDQAGELIIPIVQEGRSNPGMNVMPPLPLEDSDIVAIAEYIHSVVATSQGQGAPPRVDIELDIVVGNADLGREYFSEACSACHSVSGDLQGYASVVTDPVNIQNSWVAGRRQGVPNPDADPSKREVRVSVTLSDGEKVSGVLSKRDDFIVSLMSDAGGYRSFTLYENTSPAVVDIEVDDPMQRHRELMSELSDDDMHNVTAYMVTLK